MYFLNTDFLHEFSMHSTRIDAEVAMDNVALDTNVTYRPLRRYEMIKMFPFIRSADCEKTTDWEHPVFSETGTFLDCIPNGWQRPWFIETMLVSLKSAIQADGMDMDRIYMTDVKEKYGSLRMDFSTPVTEGHSFSDMCLAWDDNR